jgi:hypothetical protein
MRAKLTADYITHDEISDDFRRVASEPKDRIPPFPLMRAQNLFW